VTDAEALAERRRRRLWLFGASATVAAVVIAIAIAVSRTDEGTGTTTGPPEGVAEVNALYRGIPQRGNQLGRADAPVGIVEFADLQCPFCGEYSRDVMPTVVERYVRPGKVKVAFRGLAFIGEDSEEALRVAIAAGLQGKLFQFVDLVYRNQGAEESGWVDDDYLRRIGRAVGLDVPPAFAARGGPEVTGALEGAKDEAEQAGVNSTPTILIFKKGSAEPVRLDADAVSVGKVTAALDEALGG
jgi:protein-disulfide isomerase